MSQPDVALVTGASSGIGRVIAARLAGAGYRVFGTSRSPERAEPLPGVTFLPLDVTDDRSVTSCVESVLAQAAGIDLLVNNAGIATFGAVEELSIDDARRLFETNFFGLLRVTQAVLPTMRRVRAGCIVNIGSVSGLLPIPFAAMYSASKYAVEGLTEALRHEVAAFGIRVTVVEPGFFKSDLIGESQRSARELEDYRDVEQRVLERIRRIDARADPPTAVADVVLRLARQANPGLRHPVGRETLSVYLKRFLPFSVFEPQARKFWRLTA